MPRANRYIKPGYVYHMTHRCHNRKFLLRFRLAGIKNPDSQKKAQIYIDAVGTAINALQITLELYGVK